MSGGVNVVGPQREPLHVNLVLANAIGESGVSAPGPHPSPCPVLHTV